MLFQICLSCGSRQAVLWCATFSTTCVCCFSPTCTTKYVMTASSATPWLRRVVSMPSNLSPWQSCTMKEVLPQGCTANTSSNNVIPTDSESTETAANSQPATVRSWTMMQQLTPASLAVYVK